MGILSDLISRKAKPEGSEKEMTFLDHLDELRGHLFRSALVVVVLAILFFIYRQEILDVLLSSHLEGRLITYKWLAGLDPTLVIKGGKVKLIVTDPYEQFTNAMTYAFFGGLIIAAPYILWEMWRFIKPGLREKEVKAVNWNVMWMSLLFFAGILFGFFIVLPFSIIFFSQFELIGGGIIENNWRAGATISFMLILILGTGLLFQLPVVAYYLTKIGLLSSAFLKKYRRHSIVVILIVAGVFTPPDPFSQIFLAIPMLFLYEASIWLARRVEKARLAEEQAFYNNDTQHPS